MEGAKVALAQVLPNDQQLKAAKKRIADGTIDMGTPIVPITLTQRHIGTNGSTCTRQIVMRGRTFSLQGMDRTLREQEQAGFLRPPFPQEYDIEN